MKDLIKIMVSDGNPVVVFGIKAMLQEQSHLKISESFTTGKSLLDGLANCQPDLLLMDPMQLDVDGKDLVKGIRSEYPSVRIIIFTAVDTLAMMSIMMRRGCRGYILKSAEKHTLIAAIENVYAGNEFIEPALKEKIIKNLTLFNKKTNIRSSKITEREKQVLKLIVDGYTNQRIADQLYISHRTVENHRNSLLYKLDVKNSVGLTKVAIELGLVNVIV